MTLHAKSAKTSNQAQALLSRGYTVQPLTGQYVTPSSVDLPYRNYPRLHHGIRLYNSSTDSKPTQPEKVLDGFILLETTGMGFPEDARTANISGGGYHAVVVEDMLFFTGLVYLDVCDNHFNMRHFEMLPRLHELRMACNGIRELDYTSGYEALQYLDLSYNKLSNKSIDMLSHLPNLKELDLSGNNLRRLPSFDVSTASGPVWPALEVLILENNKFTDANVFYVLCSMPNLRIVNLARNCLSLIPPDVCNGFRLLETLDVAYNYYSNEDTFLGIVKLPRLLSLLLYGNPVLGPTGEDALGIYIENLIAEVSQFNDENKTLEIITEAPRAREFLKGQDPGRQAIYRHFPIVQVDDERDSVAKTAKQYREEGNATLFSSAVDIAKKQNVDLKTATNIASTTFLTAGHIKEIADGVMEKVANTMKLGDEKDVHQLEKTLKRNFSEGSDVLPTDLFSRSMVEPSSLPSYPISMNTAIKSLRFAMKHPLSNHNEVPASGLFPAKHYVKPTTLTDVRQRPKIKYVDKKKRTSSASAADTATSLGASPTKKSQALVEQAAVTFQQIEEVLDGLNINTDTLHARPSGAEFRNARPNTAIKGLIDMVHTVMDDIES